MLFQVNRTSRTDLLCFGLVALAFCYDATLTLLARNQFIPNYDVLLEADNARALLHKGEIPVRGSVSGFLAFNPPGVSWAMTAGILLFPSEPALAERVPALLLLALTLAGLYLLVARRFGAPAAMCACLVFALSANGFGFADWRWNRANPAFFIWFLYFVDDWVERRHPRALAWALVVWAASNYFMLEGVTLIIVLPIAWVAFRPPIRWRDVLFGVSLGALIWSPYLVFEAKRNFVDLRANVSRTNAMADLDAAYRNSLSDRGLTITEGYRRHIVPGVTKAAEPPPPYQWIFDPHDGWMYRATSESVKDGLRGRWTYPSSLHKWVFRTAEQPRLLLLTRAGKIWKLMLVSMPDSRVPMGGAILLFLLLASVWRAFAAPLARARRRFATNRSPRLPLLVFTFLVFVGGVWAVRRGPEAFGLGGAEGSEFLVFWLLSLAGLSVSAAGVLGWIVSQPCEAEHERERLRFLLAAAAFAPWIVQILLMVNDDSADPARRFLWLWVAQGAVIACFLYTLKWSRAFRVCSLASLILLVGLNDDSVSKTLSWYRLGFHSAPSNDFNNIVDFLGRRIRSEGRTSARIGYDIPYLKWIVVAHAVDGLSKVGSQYDAVLRARYGVTNLDSTAEGVSRDDEYRVLEYSSSQAWRQSYFDLSNYPDMAPIYTSATCAVLRRSDDGSNR